MLAFLEGPELVVVLVVLALVLGTSRLPKLARQLGQAQQELKKGLAEGADGDDDETPPALPAGEPAAIEAATTTDKSAAIEARVTDVSTVTARPTAAPGAGGSSPAAAPPAGGGSLPAPSGSIPPPAGATAPNAPVAGAMPPPLRPPAS